MVTAPVAGDGEEKPHIAGLPVALESVAVLLLMVTLAPTCCSTDANSTSCWVNWLVSSGLSGSWFCNCVVSSVRKVLKLPASSCDPTTPAACAVLVVDVVVVGVAVVVVMVRPQKNRCCSHADVAAAAEAGAGIDLLCLDDRRLGVGNDELRRARLRVAAAAVLAGEGLIAQRELQAVIGGFQPGLLQHAFELRLLVLQQLQRIGAVRRDVRRHLAVAVDVEADIDAAELGRIEPDVELAGAGLGARGDGDGKAGNRDGRRRGGAGRCRGYGRRGLVCDDAEIRQAFGSCLSGVPSALRGRRSAGFGCRRCRKRVDAR